MAKRHDLPDLYRRAAGQWDRIIGNLVPQLQPAISAGHKKKVGCPFHAGTTEKNLRVMPDFLDKGKMVCNSCGMKANGIEVLKWAGMSVGEAIRAVSEAIDGIYAGLTPEQIERQQREMEARRRKAQLLQEQNDRKYRRDLNEAWSQSLPLAHPLALPARMYLEKRGLKGVASYPTELRFHRGMPFYEEDDQGKLRYFGLWPVILARLTGAEGKPASLLRIYVAPNGDKPDLPERKKLMSTPSTTVLTGAAIRLGPVTAVMGVAEGVETALAVTKLFGITCWSTFSATLMEGFETPPGVEKLLVFADKDVSKQGERSSKILVERVWSTGVMAGTRMPPLDIPPGAKGIDWLDVLNQYSQALNTDGAASAGEMKLQTA